MAEVEKGRHETRRSWSRQLADPRDGRGREERDPQSSVGGETLLRREVVDVERPGVNAEAGGGRGGVDGDERPGVNAVRPADLHHHAGGRLVVS